MSGLNLPAIRSGLASVLEDATDLRRVYEYIPDSVASSDLPCAYIGLPDPVLYSQRFGRGAAEVTLPVTVVVGRVSAPESQAVLDRLLSQIPPTNSDDPDEPHVGIVDAVLADRSLGGALSGTTTVVERGDNLRAIDVGGTQYLAYDLIVVATS